MEINLNFADDSNFVRRAVMNEQVKLLAVSKKQRWHSGSEGEAMKMRMNNGTLSKCQLKSGIRGKIIPWSMPCESSMTGAHICLEVRKRRVVSRPPAPAPVVHLDGSVASLVRSAASFTLIDWTHTRSLGR